MSDKIICPGCGKAIKATAKHCGYCGAKIVTMPVAEPIVPVAEPTSAYVNPMEGMSGVRGRREQPAPVSTPEPVAAMFETVPSIETPPGKVCVSCGKKMPARAKFCGICGGTLVEDVGETLVTREPTVTTPEVELAIQETVTEISFMETPKKEDMRSEEIAKSEDTVPKTKISSQSSGIHPDFKPAGEFE